LGDGAALLCAALMLGFSIALATVAWRGIHLQCGCFGEFFRQSSLTTLAIRDLSLLACAVWLCWHRSR
jgi:hypothetical protein